MSLTDKATARAAQQRAELSIKMLPLLEKEAPEWLMALANQIMNEVTRLWPVQVLPIRRVEQVQTFPLIVTHQELLVIVPWGIIPIHRLNGTAYFHLLNFDALLECELRRMRI